MSDIYFIPPSFPCEKCGVQITVIISALIVPAIADLHFNCKVCGTVQRVGHFGKWFGVIKNVE